jgi:DNA polymerase-1
VSKGIIVIQDSNNTLYRMYHTQPPRVKGGQRVEAATAAVNAAVKFTHQDDVVKVICVFDANGNNFRHDIYADYKGTRSGMPEDLQPQEILAQEALAAAGIPVIVKKGFEADDAIGMVAEMYADKGYDVLIETTDKDMMQLVNDRINLINPITKKRIDAAAVKEKLGVSPARVADLLAVQGDTSDNIIGVNRVGAKTAAKLINQFGSIQGLIEHAAEIKGAVGKNVQESVGRLPLNLQLTTICADQSRLTPSELSTIDNASLDPERCEFFAQSYGFKIGPPRPAPKARPVPEQGLLM